MYIQPEAKSTGKIKYIVKYLISKGNFYWQLTGKPITWMKYHGVVITRLTQGHELATEVFP